MWHGSRQRAKVAAALGLGLVLFAGVLFAGRIAAAEPTPASGEVKQIQLNDKQVEGFIAAQKDLAAIASKIQAAGDKPDPALQKDLDDIDKKTGFAASPEPANRRST